MRRRNSTLMVTGISMTGLGLHAVPAGIVAVALFGGCYDCSDAMRTENKIPGIALIASGTALIAAGIPLWIVGAEQLPAREGVAKTLTLRIAPASAEMAWKF